MRGEKVVLTNGCFDLLHAGHLSSLEAARREGDRLVVAINSDRSVARLKGPGRPVNREEDRARVLAALGAVDAVCVFDDETPLEVIRTLRPDVLAKGADYRMEDVVGAEDVQSWGGRVVLLDLVTGLSTTELLRRIESCTT
jgi:D-beta-D-heptose 7-phosphate kinase/D-beta-D-heptose 1-phosphate adenosyltransferase